MSVCLNCNGNYFGYASFCSKECRNEFFINGRQNLKKERILERENSKFFKQIVKSVKVFNQPKCEICGFYKVIERHHINSKNIVYLCPNHHAMIHWLRIPFDILKTSPTIKMEKKDHNL